MIPLTEVVKTSRKFHYFKSVSNKPFHFVQQYVIITKNMYP